MLRGGGQPQPGHRFAHFALRHFTVSACIMIACGAIPPQRASQARRGSTTKRWPAAPVVAVAIAAAVCVVVAAQSRASSSGGLGLMRQHLAAAAAAAAGSSPSTPQCSPPFLGTFTSHKTGTAQAGCLVALAIGGASQPVAHHYENAPDGPHAAVKFAAAAAAGGELVLPQCNSCPASKILKIK